MDVCFTKSLRQQVATIDHALSRSQKTASMILGLAGTKTTRGAGKVVK